MILFSIAASAAHEKALARITQSLLKDSSILEQPPQGETRPTQCPPRPNKEESHVTGPQAPPALPVFFQSLQVTEQPPIPRDRQTGKGKGGVRAHPEQKHLWSWVVSTAAGLFTEATRASLHICTCLSAQMSWPCFLCSKCVSVNSQAKVHLPLGLPLPDQHACTNLNKDSLQKGPPAAATGV